LKRYALVGGVARFIFDKTTYADLEQKQQHAIQVARPTVLKEVEDALSGESWPQMGERLILLDVDPSTQEGYARFCSTAAMVTFMAARGRQIFAEVVRFVAAGQNFNALGAVRGHKWEDLFCTCTMAGFEGRIRKLKPTAQGRAEASQRFEHKPCPVTMFSSLPELSTYVREQQQQRKKTERIYIPTWPTLATVDAVQLRASGSGAGDCTLITYQATVAKDHTFKSKGLQTVLDACSSVQISHIEHCFVVPGHVFKDHYKEERGPADQPLMCGERQIRVDQYAVEMTPPGLDAAGQ